VNGNSGSQGEASGLTHLRQHDLVSADSPPVTDETSRT
jgi:hypothetical protein